MYIINKNFENVDKLAEYICDLYADNNNFVVLCDDIIASHLVKRFLQFSEDTVAYSVDLASPEISGYVDEYVVSNVNDELFVESARRNNNPIGISDEIPVLVQSDFVKDDYYDEKYIGNTVIKFTISE